MLNQRDCVATTLVVGVSAMAMGCGAHLFSPPGRVAPLEAAKTLEKGQHSMGVYAGPSAEPGLDFVQASARYRHGVAEHVEVGADVNLGVVTNMDEAATPVDPTVISGRVGTKWAPGALGDYFAVIGGVSGGSSVAGQFVSPDLGVIVAFENPYVVPFVSADGYISLPINAQQVDLSTKQNGAGDNMQTPLTTYGVTTAAGLRVPIELERVTLAPTAGIMMSWVTDEETNRSSAGWSLGMDVLF